MQESTARYVATSAHRRLVAITHKCLDAGPYERVADLAEDVKRAAAQQGIPYSADAISKALADVEHRRPLVPPLPTKRVYVEPEPEPPIFTPDLAAQVLAELRKRIGQGAPRGFPGPSRTAAEQEQTITEQVKAQQRADYLRERSQQPPGIGRPWFGKRKRKRSTHAGGDGNDA